MPLPLHSRCPKPVQISGLGTGTRLCYTKTSQIADLETNIQSSLLLQSNIGTKCNSLTQQFIGISTTIATWATCFDSYRVIFRPSTNTDPISKVVKYTVGSSMLTK